MAKGVTWILVGILILAFVLRVSGVTFGLPYLYHPDEVNKIGAAQQIFKTGNLNPHYFKKPAFIIYLNAAAYVPYYLIGKTAGIFETRQDLPAPQRLAIGTEKISMPSIVLLGRMLTVLFGIAAVFLVFLIGKMIISESGGLLAALIMAVSPTSVKLSRFITPDTFVVFFILLTIYASLQIFEKGQTKYYVLAGIASGLAVASKYNGLLIIIVPILAHFLRNKKALADYRVYLIIAITILTFFIINPYAVIENEKFTNTVISETKHYSKGHPGMEGNSIPWYFQYTFKYETLAFLGIFGLFYGFRQKKSIILMIFPIVYFIIISSVTVRNDRTLFPILPILFLYASAVTILFYKKSARKTTRFIVLGLIVLFLSFSLYHAIHEAVKITRIDSRKTAPVWIEQNLPPGSKMAIEAYGPYVEQDNFTLVGIWRIIDKSPQWYAEREFDYVIFGEAMFGRFFKDPERYPRQVEKYNEFFEEFELTKQFNDGDYEIRIYKVVPIE